MEDVVCGARAVGLQVVVIEVIVVDEGAIEHHAPVRRERVGQQIGGIGGTAPITRRSCLALRVGLHRESREVRDLRINLVDLRGPPRLHRRIEWVKSFKTADLLWTGDVTLMAKRTPHGRMVSAMRLRP